MADVRANMAAVTISEFVTRSTSVTPCRANYGTVFVAVLVEPICYSIWWHNFDR